MHKGISEIVDQIIAAGPRAGEALAEVGLAVEDGRSMVGHLHQAGVILTGRSADTERAAVVLSEEDNAALGRLEEHLATLPTPRSGSLPRGGKLADLLAFLNTHKELLLFFLSFLKK